MRAVLFVTCALFASALTACQAGAPPPSDRGDPRSTAESPAPSARSAGDEGDPGGVRGRAGGGSKSAPNQASAAAIKPLEKTKFGEPITESTTTPLPTIVKDPGQYSAKTIRTEGMVSSVCQSAGCWMQIADTSGKAHIKMAGHSFFVPKESSGHRAVVQGRVLGGSAPNTCADSDRCGNQEVTQVQIEATGVEFID
jgi:hypothetical protein